MNKRDYPGPFEGIIQLIYDAATIVGLVVIFWILKSFARKEGKCQ